MTGVSDWPALVGGQWRAGVADQWVTVNDPARTADEVARVPALDADDVRAAYEAAVAAFPGWRAAGGISRGSVLTEAARLLRGRRTEIATDLVREMGKTLAEATVEVTKAADFLDFYGGLGRTATGYQLEDARPDTEVTVRREPLGVVLAITPWNDPLLTPARKLGPALFAGNVVILKPATDTPLVSLHLARALADAGLPHGVLSVVTGRGRDISAALLRAPQLSAVTFTGSNSVGDQIRHELVASNVRVQAELGGKNATAVLADADLELAASTIAAAAFAQAGQRCTATSRLVLDRAISAQLLTLLVDHAKAYRLGHGLDPATTLGPVVNLGHQASLLDAIALASGAGATLLTGGAAPSADDLTGGCFVEPTIFAGVTPDMPVWRDELFGPVLAVVETAGFDEACERVNDSRFGLSASIFTQDLAYARSFVDRVETGQVAVNLPTSGWDVHQPFGGFRDSGSAFKEQGTDALQFYTRTKTAAVHWVGR